MSRATQLQSYLDSAEGQAFAWDALNCCHFSGRWVETVTGKNPMTGLRVTATPEEARALIAEMGGLMQATTTQLGIEPVDAKQAQLGDVVYVELSLGYGAIGICVGRQLVLLNTNGDFSRLNLDKATCAWRIL